MPLSRKPERSALTPRHSPSLGHHLRSLQSLEPAKGFGGIGNVASLRLTKVTSGVH